MATEPRVGGWRAAVCLAGLVLLLLWQVALFRMPWSPDYRVGNSGVTDQDRFTYFLYYTGYFPIASLKSGMNDFVPGSGGPTEPDRLDYSVEGAQRLL